ncbi:hypothetical protein [Sporosarcina sp. HYO08]|uniref:hypothetical protein n=1 Tax=Sporosarcina sp. HYO08 TaxID=1759557 RepID=UPI00079A98E0|nr:hypothetical protein [Sporosarcina sp. HYO08]KXH79825.1 hypothetical protein AU377_10105 [Sporosarcina sp. HYO08]
MRKKIALLCTVIFTLLALLPFQTAQAAGPDLKVKITTGLDGKVKYGKGAHLILTIENNGASFNGDLVLDISSSYRVGNGEAIPLTIDSGETKTLSVIVPSISDHHYGMQSKSIYFYEGGWEKGKEIAHKGAQQFTTSMFYGDTKFLVAFTNQPDRLSALKTVKVPNATNQQLIYASKMEKSLLPNDADGWGAADYIIIDEYPIADLSEARQKALLNWVRAGGIMIVGASDNLKGEVGILSDYLPFTLEDKIKADASALDGWAGEGSFKGQISMYNTTSHEGSHSLFTSSSNVLVAYKTIGQGAIIQTAFSLGDAPLATMPDVTALWNQLVASGDKLIQHTTMYSESPMEGISHTIGDSNELFPSFKVSTPLLFGLILLYIIVTIPVLYFVLKRKDKREHAWWIIPTIAIITSIAIFAIGAKNRIGNAQIQVTAVLQAEQDGSLSGYYAQSLLSNKAGDFTLTAPAGTTMNAAVSTTNFFGPSDASSHKQAMLERGQTGAKMHLFDIGYWSVKSIYGKTMLEQLGQYESTLKVDQKKLTGTITNTFPFELKDAAIWSGTKLIPLGDMGAGETLEVNETLKTSALVASRPMFNTYMNPSPTNVNDLTELRKESLFTFTSQFMQFAQKPMIIGYTNAQIIPVELENGRPSISSLAMIMQPIDVEMSFSGTIEIEPEMMGMSLVGEKSQMEAGQAAPTGNRYYFEEPMYEQKWQLPADIVDRNMNWKSLKLKNIQNGLYEVELWNSKLSKFEKVKDSKLVEMTSHVEDYISPDGTIMLQLRVSNTMHGTEGRAPELWLSGEVAQ